MYPLQNNLECQTGPKKALIILGIYVAVRVLLYFLQEYLIFKPEQLPIDFQFYYDNQEIEEYDVETRDGAMINGLCFKAQNPTGIVFYF